MKVRCRAFIVHLIVSVVILSFVFFVARCLWYPAYFYHLDGGVEASKVIFIVDLVIGPLLTLVVFKPGKKGLKFDFALIASLQISALLYGVFLLYDYRPVALVLQNNTFFSVTVDVYDNYSIDYQSSASKASLVSCELDCYIIENNYEAKTHIQATGIPARVSPQFYLDYASKWEEFTRQESPFTNVSLLGEELEFSLRESIGRVARAESLEVNEVGVVPVYGRYYGGYLALKINNGNILEFIDLTPPMMGGSVR